MPNFISTPTGAVAADGLRGHLHVAVREFEETDDAETLFDAVIKAVENHTDVFTQDEIEELAVQAAAEALMNAMSAVLNGEPETDMAEDFYRYFQREIDRRESPDPVHYETTGDLPYSRPIAGV